MPKPSKEELDSAIHMATQMREKAKDSESHTAKQERESFGLE